MRNLFLLGTALVIASNVWAFGGIGIGGKSSSRRESGVDAIGIHINGKSKANIDIIDGDSEICPEERQCGDVCCSEGNMCNTATGQCCRQEYDGSMGECCPTGSLGYSTNDGGCCGDGTTPYVSYYSVEESMNNTSCCAPDKVYRIYDYDYYEGDELWRYYEQGCCEDTIYPGVGYKGWNVCCDHEPVDYTNNKGETFKVCWTNDTECTTNEKCQELYGDGYYCNVKNEVNYSCNYPASGTCEAIGESTPASNITGLGNVIMSNGSMTWWAADNWCKAQGMRLANVEEFNCYYSGTNNPIEEGTEQYGYCCSGNNAECDYWYSHWNWGARTMDDTEDNYSPVIVDLAKAYGNNKWFWTATDFASDNSCLAFTVFLNFGFVSYDRRDSDYYALCK